MKNILNINTREEFRNWLQKNIKSESECWINLKRGKPINNNIFYYLDAVEEALCFGWIDSIQKLIDNKCMQRFTPRKKNSSWTELNKERVRRLEKLGLMTDAGRAVLPLSIKTSNFNIDLDIKTEMQKAQVWSKFKSFPLLYQRIRVSNLISYKKYDILKYKKFLMHLIEKTRQGHMFGQWNDYGRLLNY